MITTLEQYIEGVLESESAEQPGWRAAIPTKLWRVDHALTGLTTEIGELIDAARSRQIDWVNVKEELGDIWWYAALLIDALGLRGQVQVREVVGVFSVRDGCSPSHQCMEVRLKLLRLTSTVGGAFDVKKRRYWYMAEELEDGHPKKEKARWELIRVDDLIYDLSCLVEIAGFTNEEIWTSNLRKLIGPNGRYAGKFDPNKALHRDLVAERAILES